MADIVTDLATKCGISPDLVKLGLGAILNLIQKKVSPEIFSTVTSVIPGAKDMIAASQSAPESSGGITGAVAGVVGKLLGGDAAAITTKLTQLGFSPEQLQSFLPQVLEFFNGKLPDEALEQLSGLASAAK